jgi:hypothetical protein
MVSAAPSLWVKSDIGVSTLRNISILSGFVGSSIGRRSAATSHQGAETYDRYISDAEERNDGELADFFRDVQTRNCEIAERGQRLLAGRLVV